MLAVLSYLALIASYITLLIWLVLFFAWGNFWRVWEFDADHASVPDLEKWPRVTAVVPARNEAQSIAAVVAALARQDYPGEFSVIVVDDHSEDATAELARKSAAVTLAAVNSAISIQVLCAPELAPGWTGKLRALNSGVTSADHPVRASVAASPDTTPSAATAAPQDFLWFTDADVVHSPDTLRRLVARAECTGLDLVSLMVLLKAVSFSERLLIPPFLYFS